MSDVEPIQRAIQYLRDWDELGAHDAQAEYDTLRASHAELREALQALTDMYKHIWDRADGCIVLMPDRVEQFEKASTKADRALARASTAIKGE